MQNSLFTEDHLNLEEAPDAKPRTSPQIEESAPPRDDAVAQNDESAQPLSKPDSDSSKDAQIKDNADKPVVEQHQQKSHRSKGAHRYQAQGHRFRQYKQFDHASNVPALSQKTQQTISKCQLWPFLISFSIVVVQIIQTLRLNQSTPDAAQQLFKTLSETSDAIQRRQRTRVGKANDAEVERSEEPKPEAAEKSVRPSLPDSAASWVHLSQEGNSIVAANRESLAQTPAAESSSSWVRVSEGSPAKGEKRESSGDKLCDEKKEDEDSVDHEEVKVELEDAEDEAAGAMPEEEAPLTIEDQLQLLLANLQKNVKLKKEPLNNQPGAKKQPATDAAFTDNAGASHGAIGVGDSGWVEWNQNSQLITKAYNMINEVIMHPTIMWNRQFFYSLGAMAPQE